MHRIIGMRPVGIFLAVSVLLAAASGAVAESSADGCSQINKLALKDVSAIDAQFVEPGNLKFGDSTADPGLKSFCRVRATAMPTKDSDIQFEVGLQRMIGMAVFGVTATGGLPGQSPKRGSRSASQTDTPP
jgi:hypothetical protein